MDSSSFDICTTPTDFYRLASGLRAFFLIIGTHLLAGEVDTTLTDAPLWERLSWLLRYFNPVNLSWRYYSVLSYRVAVQARARTGAGDWDDAVGMAESEAGGGGDGDHIGGGSGGGGKGLGGLCWNPCRWPRAGTKANVERMAETADSSGGGGGGSGGSDQTSGPNCLCWNPCKWGRAGAKANVECMAETGGSSGGGGRGRGDQTGGYSVLCWTPRRWGRAGAKANLECMAETGDSGSNQTGGHGGLRRNSSGDGAGILRCTPCHTWGDTQMAIINHEAHPFKSPIPYGVAENHAALHVRRLEPAGLFSSQGILTVSAGFQGVLALQYTVSTAGVAFLPNMTMPLAIMGLFRTAVSPWITSKVYVDPHCYPGQDVPASDYKPNRLLALGWLCILSGLVFLSFWPYLAYPAFDLPQDIMKLWIQIFYQYATISTLLFHAVLLRHGSLAWANRILFFDHWVYKVQTLGFMGILLCMLALGVSDFVRQDYYRHCG